MTERLPHNLGVDLMRATERAALKAGRWMGLGDPEQADQAATTAFRAALDSIDIDGTIIISEEKPGHDTAMSYGKKAGSGKGPTVDVVGDPIDGCLQLAMGHPGALSVVAVAPSGSMWAPPPAIYMSKIVVDQQVSGSLVPECVDAPAAWTLALVGRAKDKSVNDLTVFILDRPRHADLIDEIRATGARVVLRPDGDIAGALMACSTDSSVDILMGVGGVLEGLIIACAVKSLKGAMLGRLAPQDEGERSAVAEAGYDLNRILTCDDLVASEDVYFAATGITTGPMLTGISYHGERASSNSLILRGVTRTKRSIVAEHLIDSL